MNLQGKKVLFLGDSITEGACASSVENRYVSVFSQLSGCIAYNFGLGGSRIARQSEIKSPYDRDFIMRADEMPNEADAIVVFGGTNDFGHGDAPFGNENDYTEYTFGGACNVLFTKLKERYKNAEIIVVLPLHRVTEIINCPPGEIIPKDKLPLYEYAQLLYKVACKHNLKVCNLRGVDQLNPTIEEYNNLNFTDGLHPNDNGHKILAEKLYEFFTNI